MKRAKRRCMVIVELDMPPETTKTKIADYVNGETRTGRGSRHPNDPIFDLDPESVKARSPHPDIVAVVTLMMGSAIRRRQVANAVERDLLTGDAYKEIRARCKR